MVNNLIKGVWFISHVTSTELRTKTYHIRASYTIQCFEEGFSHYDLVHR